MNVGKGSRQVRSVTSGKGLALRVGPVGLGWETGSGLVHGLDVIVLSCFMRACGFGCSVRVSWGRGALRLAYAGVHPRNVLARRTLGETLVVRFGGQ